MKIKNLKIRTKLIALLTAGTITLSLIPVKAQAEFKETSDTVTTTANVNLRLDDSLSGDIIDLVPKNQEVERILESDTNWDLVIYKNQIGFIYHDYVKEDSEELTSSSIEEYSGYIKITSHTEVTLNPSSSTSIATLNENDIIEVIAKTSNNYYLIKTNKTIGYIPMTNTIYLGTTIKTMYTNNDVNLRENNSVESNRITTLKKDTEVKALKEEDGWTKVIYNNQEGYIKSEYLNNSKFGNYRDDMIKIVYAITSLRLREEPNTESEILYVLDKYETAEVIEEQENWYKVRCANKEGYIAKKYTQALSDKFVVVDISDQKLTLYDNNQIILETSVVTGKENKSDTPTGMYSIYAKAEDTYLVGNGYRSHVDYWMPFNGGVGLHDADWRQSFGGTIYKTNGSHGCVNIPPEYADDIYNEVSVKTKVLVQK